MRKTLLVSALFVAQAVSAAIVDIEFIGDLVKIYYVSGRTCAVDVSHLMKDEVDPNLIVTYVLELCGRD